MDLKFPPSSTPGATPAEGEGRLINGYMERGGEAWFCRRSPGVANWSDAFQTNPRSFFTATNGRILGAYTGVVIQMIDSSSSTLSGSLPGSDGVSWAENNIDAIVVCRSAGGAYVVLGGAVAPYSPTYDVDVPADANSVTFGNGYFIFSQPNGQIWASDLNSYAIDPLSFATAESRPDGLLRVIWHGGVLYAFGFETIEPWLDVGDTPFPLTRGTSVIPVGLAAPMAVAGFEQGWDRPIHFVAHDGTVRALLGYETKVVSTKDVERFVAASMASTSTAATLAAFVYTFRGNAMWVLTSDLGTWEYNVATGLWNERDSLATGGWRVRYSAKGQTTMPSGPRWYVGDTVTSGIGHISEASYTEWGAVITWVVESGPLKGFPSRVAIPSLFADFTEASANVTIDWSHDGGKSWSTPLTRSLADAEKWPVRVNRLGLSTQHGLRVRLTVNDTAGFTFFGAAVGGPARREPIPRELETAT